MSERQNYRGQVSTMLGQIVTHQRRFEEMTSEDRQWVINNTNAALDLFVQSVASRNTILANTRQIAALKYLISWAGKGGELGNELLKKMLFVLVESSEGLTKDVYITLEAGKEFTIEEIRDLALRLDGMNSANGVTHLAQIMVATGSELTFDVHFGGYDDGHFNTTGQLKQGTNDPAHRYTFWLARGPYGWRTGDDLTQVAASRQRIEAVDLTRVGLYPDIEKQEPPYKSRPVR